MSVILDHVTLAAADFARSLAFYDAALAPMGLTRAAEFGDEEQEAAPLEVAGWGDPDGTVALWVITARAPTSGAHVCMRAVSADAVRDFHRAAVAAGGVSRNPPRRWPIYRCGDFHAVVADPDGNLIEAVAAE